jgi:hypothetical protein
MKKLYLSVLFVTLLSSCGTDTSSKAVSNGANPNNAQVANDVTYTITKAPGSSNPQSGDITLTEPARLTLNITDAPLDDVVKVVVTFLSVELVSKDNLLSHTFTFNTPKPVDLLALQGLQFETLLSEVELAAGDYKEMRLVIDDTNMSSYVETSDGSVYPLKIPGGSSSGLKIKSKISFVEKQTSAYTLDFDLNKSVVMAGASGKYNLKPVLRLVKNSEVGHIRGVVDAALLTSTDCSDNDVDTYNAVYLYQGFDITPEDINTNSVSGNQPVTTTLIKFDKVTGEYMFEAAYLPAGEYTLAFTCSADLDMPEKDDNVPFFETKNVTVQINDIMFL